jgi:hypothetical protein
MDMFAPFRVKAGRWLLAATVAGAALAVGTVHTITLCVVTAALAAAAALLGWERDVDEFRPRPAATLLVATGVALTAYTAIQCVPLPVAWLAVIAPRNADVWSHALSPLRQDGPAWAPISLDPTATRVEVLKGVAYLLAFVSALRVARTREGVAFLSAAIVLTGVTLATAALLHPAFGAQKLYGVFGPSPEVLVYDKHVAPFLNPNNLAAYLNVAFCLTLAATLAPEPRWPRPIVAAVSVLLASTQVWVASRGGVGTMVLGAALVVAMSRAQRMKRPRRRNIAAASLAAGLAATAGAFMVVLGGSTQTANELFDADLSKLVLVKQSLRMLPSYGLLGSGRGAFESTFPAVRTMPGIVVFTHPENVIAQWTTEWGIPIGLAGLLAIVIGLRPNTVLARSSTAAGAWAGLIAVAVQNLVDLGSEIPGLVLAPVVCAAIVVGGSAGRRPRHWLEGWGDSPRLLTALGAIVAPLAIAAGAIGIRGELRNDRQVLQQAAVGRDTDALKMEWLARAAMLRHPAEPYVPFIAGWRAWHQRDADPMGWLEAALDRGHVNSPAHLVLARMLSVRSPSQARLEYRLAYEQAPELGGTLSREVSRLVSSYDDAMELVSEGKRGDSMLRTLSEGIASRLPASSERLDEELSLRDPMEPGPAVRRARGAMEDLEAGASASWCQGQLRDACSARGIAAASRAELLEPTLCEPYVLRARMRVDGGQVGAGLSDLAQAADTVVDRVGCLEELVTMALAAHDDARANSAMAKIVGANCSQEAECSRNLTWVASIESQRGNGRHALSLFKRACERSPENDGILEATARLEASLGLHADAREDFRHLARRHPENAEWPRAADTQQQAVMAAAAEPAPTF